LDGCNFIGLNRKGWRAPTHEELGSLVDPSLSNPPLPAGHPFSTGGNGIFWTATTAPDDPLSARVVNFSSNGATSTVLKSSSHRRWCVRGGGQTPQTPQ
jgi:hypothetical protein